jgi:hypothetical protein
MNLMCRETEIQAVFNAIQSINANYKPQLIYTLVDKNSGIRMLEKYNNNGHIVNPGPGTCIDSGVVERDGDKLFDFYMVSNNNPTTATALPVKYEVAFNNSDLSKREFEEFTYHQAHNYVGFGGPVKVPASLKLAERLANYTKIVGFNGSSAQELPNNMLANYMHYI